jgi:prepilin-type processing-associated H-X9-DG protein
LEQEALHSERDEIAIEETLLAVFNCPTRRALAPNAAGRAIMDYACSTPGDKDDFWQGGRQTLPRNNATYYGMFTRSRTAVHGTFKRVTDGLTTTMMIAEKRCIPSAYYTGDWNDERGWLDGWDADTVRSTGVGPEKDGEQVTPARTIPPPGSSAASAGGGQAHFHPPVPPRDVGLALTLDYAFGSAHSGSFNVLFGDASVRAVRYAIDVVTFNHLGHRDDGQVVADTDAF